ncbi:MAG: VCBS repeat-containing protein, partial [Myxococcota bacterium]|nr:VCBS repeat-containing protein [Myxococcota bacterium]
RVVEFPAPGRVSVAGIADLDGDGRRDLYAISLTGIPPNSRRELRVHFQDAGGRFRTQPDWAGAVQPDAAAFDAAILGAEPRSDLLFLRRHSVLILSFPGRKPRFRELEIPGDPTAAVGPDERGIDRLRMVLDLGAGPQIAVPGLGEYLLLAPDGQLQARLDVGQRANYFAPSRPGPLVNESEFETFLDFPRVELGDVDGDGRVDLLFASRHELRVFLQKPDGSFGAQADRQIALGRLSEKDLFRGSGSVRVAAGDLNGDQHTDLLIATTTGGIREMRSETTVHLNRNGHWDLETPDRSSVVERGWNTLQVLDLDGDDKPELVEARIPFSILELIEALMTREVDIEVSVFRTGENGVFSDPPWVETSLHMGIDFDSLSLEGFPPTLGADLNGDGINDRIESMDGEQITIYLGGGERPFQKTAVRQRLDAHGLVRFGDLDGNGLTDILLFSPGRPGSPVRVLLNRGTLPGTPRHAKD